MEQNKIGPDGLTPSERFVQYAISIGALEFVPEGRKLKSGRISPYFFNSGLFNTGATVSELGKVYASAILSHFAIPQVIFGPAYKGIPLSVITAVALTSATGENVGYAFDRKEEKTHGDGGTIVGAPLDNVSVVLVDDVMTTGTSSGEAFNIVCTKGGDPIGCVIAFDRQERSKEGDLSATQEFEQNYGIPVVAAATLADLVSFLQKRLFLNVDDPCSEILEKILAYQKEYGVS